MAYWTQLWRYIPAVGTYYMFFDAVRLTTYQRIPSKLLLVHLLPSNVPFATRSGALGSAAPNQPRSLSTLLKSWEGFLLWCSHWNKNSTNMYVYASKLLWKYSNLLTRILSPGCFEENSLLSNLTPSRGGRKGRRLQSVLKKRTILDFNVHVFSDIIHHSHLLLAMKKKNFVTIGLAPLSYKVSTLIYKLPIFYLSYHIQIFFLNIIRLRLSSVWTYNTAHPHSSRTL